MRKIFLSLSIILAFCLSSIAFAASCLPAKPCGFAKTGVVVGAMAGYGKLDTPARGIFTSSTSILYNQSYKIGYFTWGVNLGYNYAVTSKWLVGFLMGYKDLGQSRYHSTRTDSLGVLYIGDVKITQQAADFLLSGQYFLYQGLNIFAQAGGAFLRTHRKNFYYNSDFAPSQNALLTWNKTQYNMIPEVVFGIGYMVNNLNLYMMYDHILHTNGNIFTNFAAPKNSANQYSYGFDGIFAGFTYTIPKEYL